MEPGALRRDAPGLLGHRRAHRRHGHRRRLGLAVLPVAARRVRGHGVLAAQGPGARSRVRARVERLAHRGVGRHVSRAHHPDPDPLAERPGGRGRGDPPQRGARLQGGVLRREPAPTSELPSMHTTHWDPFLRCVRGDRHRRLPPHRLVAWTAARSPDAPLELYATLFPANALADARPTGCGPGCRCASRSSRSRCRRAASAGCRCSLDRLDYVVDHSGSGGRHGGSTELTPSEVLQRNFWFCTIDDPSTLALRHRIGVDHIMVECDYPHADSTWPDIQLLVDDALRRAPRRRGPQDHVRERGEAVPPPAPDRKQPFVLVVVSRPHDG